MNTSTPSQVHIAPNGQLHLNNEPQHVPDGVDPSHVVVQALHIEAAGTGLPVLVHVQDERTGSDFAMQVMPDGTTQAPGTAPATPRPPAQLNPTLADRLAAAQAAGRAHDFDTATATADDILRQLTAEQGDTAPATLEAAQFRADLAYLSGEYSFATASWTWLALAWFDHLGPGKRLTQIAAQNAAQAWMQLPPHDAAPLHTELVNMLLEVATPERTATMRAQINDRLARATSN
ncbi:hypothetical protein OG728_38440 (plasmid) [Streptomyces microflavus]|uniref:hypothetical protein n=1 Tax=Streptomyces microflavus TaxID=1919 RepID=UPI002E10E6BE|nr:hypothetical protein OG728_38440 [Streptomyces microflavus]